MCYSCIKDDRLEFGVAVPSVEHIGAYIYGTQGTLQITRRATKALYNAIQGGPERPLIPGLSPDPRFPVTQTSRCFICEHMARLTRCI